MREMPIHKAADIIGETDQRLLRLPCACGQGGCFTGLVEHGLRWADERNHRKGHQYFTVFADLAARRVSSRRKAVASERLSGV